MGKRIAQKCHNFSKNTALATPRKLKFVTIPLTSQGAIRVLDKVKGSDFSKDELEVLLKLSPSVYFKWENSATWTILQVSSNVKELLGYNQEEIMQNFSNYSELIHPEDINRVSQEFINSKKSNNYTYQPYRLRKKNGDYVWVEESSKIVDEGYILGSIVDISSLVNNTKGLSKVTAFLENYKRALNESSIVTKSDKRGIITYVNRKFLQITGFTKEECIGRPHSINRHPDTPKSVFKNLWETISNKKVWKGVLKNRKKDGTAYWVNMTILPMVDDSGEIVEYIGVRYDITTIMEQRETIIRQAFTHPLTKLPNRQKLLKDLKELAPSALALIDVDKFSQINDLYGYHNGDTILNTLSKEIHKHIKQTQTYKLYHLGADEFVITSTKDGLLEFETYIRNLLESIDHLAVKLEGIHVMLDLTCGISFEHPSQQLQTAAMAMKHARVIHNDIVIYKDDLAKHKEYEANIFWSSKLHIALLQNKLKPYYQPIVNNQTLQWEKYEALVRLIDSDGAVHSPFHFLNIAKQTKQYKAITRTMIEQAFEVFKDRSCAVSINISIDDIMDSQTRSFIIQSIQESKIGSHLVLEIVESEGIENFKEVKVFIQEAKALGCQIAIDDFGTGYSNFSYLLQLNPDFIKIDGSMIRNITTDKNSFLIVQTIVHFAKSIGMKTIAEFVKDKTTFETVKELGIDYSQGYYFSQPLPSIPAKCV